ncbi:MAG TPA: hypothetical protein ENJ09_08480 [Planctomycetes bacterium]|nr:hypothetical protein [Planctomycetota bacterium]
MRLAVLFWCYKAPDLCEDRLAHLRRQDPDVKVFVLFGGDPAEAKAFEERLSPYANDFYCFEGEPPVGSEELDVLFRGGTHWKYYFGDLLIAAWYRERGRELEFDSITLIQWDMVMWGRVSEVFASLGEGEALFSGLRPIAPVEDKWAWTTPDRPEERARYLEFLDHVRSLGFDGEPEGYVAVVTCLPRAFLERFIEIERPDLGFLEYRLPIYARLFGTPICERHPFRPWWGAVEPYSKDHTLRARPVEIRPWTIRKNLRDPNGARLFHPYWHRTPAGLIGWTRALVRGLRSRD